MEVVNELRVIDFGAPWREWGAFRPPLAHWWYFRVSPDRPALCVLVPLN